MQNVTGLNDQKKRDHVLTTLSNMNPDVLILVDTKLPELLQVNIQKSFGMTANFSGFSSTEKGVAIFTKNIYLKE